MKAFVELFRDIVLWRKGPQDLPASTLLLALAVLTYVAASAAQLAVMGEGAATWIFFLLLDPALLAASVWLMLKLYSHPERFLQTATAVLGAGAYLSIVLYLQHGTGATLFTGVAFALTYFFFINLLLGLVQGGGA